MHINIDIDIEHPKSVRRAPAPGRSFLVTTPSPQGRMPIGLEAKKRAMRRPWPARVPRSTRNRKET